MQALHLYRNILKEHRRLPSVMKKLGDEYVRNEFKLHKASKPDQVKQFVTAWTSYLNHMSKKTDRVGLDMDDSEHQHLSSEQRSKLLDLKSRTEKDTAV